MPGGVHRQRQGRRALRVWREGLHRHQQTPGSWGPARAARQGATYPYDGHTLPDLIDRTETLTGYPSSGPTRDTAATAHKIPPNLHLWPEARRLRCHQARAAPPLRHRTIIRHLKAEGHLGRCYLEDRAGDAANVILSAVGHNFRHILAWLRELLAMILGRYVNARLTTPAQSGFLTDD